MRIFNFSNYSITRKLVVGFGLVSAVIAGLVIATSVLLSGVEDYVNNYIRVAGNTIKGVETDGDLSDMRRNVLMYYTKGDKDLLAEARRTLDSSIDSTKKTLQQARVPATRKLMEEIVDRLDSYRSGLEMVVAKIAERDELTAKFVPVGTAAMNSAGAAAKRLADSGQMKRALTLTEGIATVAQARTLNARFLRTPTSELVADTVKMFKTAESIIASAKVADDDPQAAAAIDVALRDIALYRTTFDKVSAVILETEELMFTRLVTLGNAIGTLNDRLKTERLGLLRDSAANAADGMRSATTLQIGLGIVAVLIGVLLAWAISRTVARPVVRMSDAMRRIAADDLTVEIAGADRRDEIGQMAKALAVFKQAVVEKAQSEAQRREARQQAEAEKRAGMATLADNFERAVGGIVEMVASAATELQASASSLTATAEETTNQAVAVSAASEEASVNVRTVAEATDAMSSSIRDIERHVVDQSRIATTATNEAKATTDTILELSGAAQKIGEVVELISTIAAQTNLLALNATIEAARAGEAGRGFAVVASEVKLLADQTAKATQDIGKQIGAIQTSTGSAVGAISSISGTIEQMNAITATIASAVQRQAGTSAEIARNVQQASIGTAETSNNIAGVTRAAEESGAGAAQVLDASRELASNAERLRTEVRRFLDGVRAA